jgi:hypothetical protein
MGAPRKYSGPLRPGELSANYVQNQNRIRAKLKREGDYKQCYCPFFARKAATCQCIQCPMCDMKGTEFVNNMCQMCDAKMRIGIHHTQPSLLSK